MRAMRGWAASVGAVLFGVILAGACSDDAATGTDDGGEKKKKKPSTTSAGGGGAGGGVGGSTAETTSDASSSSSGQGGTGGAGGCAEVETVLWANIDTGSGFARYATYFVPNQEGSEDDVMELQLIGGPGDMTGTFNLGLPPDNNGLTCERCLLAGVDPSTTQRLFFPQSGTLAIDPSSSPLSGRLVATMTDVTMIEVTLDQSTFETTPVPGGKCLHVAVSELDVGAPPGWLCSPGYYHGADGCDCGCGAVDADCASPASTSCDWCPPGSCANDGTQFGCEESFVDMANNAQCICSCAGVECGDDGCGQSCGTCTLPETCDAQGQCVCVPDCTGLECGSDGCSGSCGACSGGEVCNGGTCCTPDCTGLECGSDGCGGSCGPCAGNELCISGQCVCQPSCAGVACGSDGCGGSCGTCGGSQVCVGGQCCTPNCAGKNCGPNGCGGSCGTCAPGDSCTPAGTCCTNPASCTLDADCCNGLHCEFFSSACVACIPNGSFYETNPQTTCCSGIGFGNQCYACLPPGVQCTSNSQCCSNSCSGVCQ